MTFHIKSQMDNRTIDRIALYLYYAPRLGVENETINKLRSLKNAICEGKMELVLSILKTINDEYLIQDLLDIKNKL